MIASGPKLNSYGLALRQYYSISPSTRTTQVEVMARSRRPRTAPQDHSSEHAPDVITTTSALEELVAGFANAEFLAIDTEFMREQTYYSQLCLVQISDGTTAAAIDPLASGIDMSAL